MEGSGISGTKMLGWIEWIKILGVGRNGDAGIRKGDEYELIWPEAAPRWHCYRFQGCLVKIIIWPVQGSLRSCLLEICWHGSEGKLKLLSPRWKQKSGNLKPSSHKECPFFCLALWKGWDLAAWAVWPWQHLHKGAGERIVQKKRQKGKQFDKNFSKIDHLVI